MRHLFFIFVVGPLALFAWIFITIYGDPRGALEEFLALPWWVQLLSISIGVGTFFNTVNK